MSKRFAFVYHNYCRYLNYQYALLEAHCSSNTAT